MSTADPFNAFTRRERVAGIAFDLAKSFRDKFDFSERSVRIGEKNHFELLADISFQAAEALVAKAEALEAEALKKEEKAHV